MAQGTGGASAGHAPNLLDEFDESERNEAIGRLLKLENEDMWNELLGAC